MNHNFFYLTLIIICSSCCCKTEQTKSEDFTEEHKFTGGIEGPAVNKNGDLFAVNYEKEGTIGIVDKGGKGSIFLTLPEGSIGNGIRFDSDNNMFIADYAGHKIYKVKKGSTTPEVWAENTAMSQPNDLAISSNNQIYLSDPNWKESTGRLWMVDENRNIILLEDNMGTTNGIEVSPNGKTLYVNESVQRIVWKYDIIENGRISNKTKFLSFEDFGLDGMRCDATGNLYITRHGKGTVIIVSPTGETIKEISLTGKKPSNIAFGGKDGKTCFVTMADRGNIETFTALYPGSYYARKN